MPKDETDGSDKDKELTTEIDVGGKKVKVPKKSVEDIALGKGTKGGVQDNLNKGEVPERAEQIDDNTYIVDGEIYDVPTKQARFLTKYIVDAWGELGKPKSPLSESGDKLMKVVISAWRDTYPKQYLEWENRAKKYQSRGVQISERERIKKGTGRNKASIPELVYRIMKVIFPEFEITNKRHLEEFIEKYPIFSLIDKDNLPKETWSAPKEEEE